MFGPFLGPSSDKNNSDESQERTKTCPAITSVKSMPHQLKTNFKTYLMDVKPTNNVFSLSNH